MGGVVVWRVRAWLVVRGCLVLLNGGGWWLLWLWLAGWLATAACRGARRVEFFAARTATSTTALVASTQSTSTISNTVGVVAGIVQSVAGGSSSQPVCSGIPSSPRPPPIPIPTTPMIPYTSVANQPITPCFSTINDHRPPPPLFLVMIIHAPDRWQYLAGRGCVCGQRARPPSTKQQQRSQHAR